MSDLRNNESLHLGSKRTSFINAKSLRTFLINNEIEVLPPLYLRRGAGVRFLDIVKSI
jgi:hypothetical protein